MSKRSTVNLNVEKTLGRIKIACRSYAVFCEKMGRPSYWVTEWKRKPKPANLPSPEEAARMCAILQVEPEEILTDSADIELVKSLIAHERKKEKPSTPEGEGLYADTIRLLTSLTPEEVVKVQSFVQGLIAARAT